MHPIFFARGMGRRWDRDDRHRVSLMAISRAGKAVGYFSSTGSEDAQPTSGYVSQGSSGHSIDGVCSAKVVALHVIDADLFQLFKYTLIFHVFGDRRFAHEMGHFVN